MVNNFSYVKAGTLAEAIRALGAKGAWLHAGGTDLLSCAHNEIIRVDKVVSISGLKQLKGITAGSGGGLKIGALTPLADIACHAEIGEKYAVLAQAAAAVGSPQIREQGTIGGNLCQRPRCWYFRSSLQCKKKGGSVCYAMSGENQYHAVFGGGPCFFVHPSDTAVALSALEAQLSISGPSGSRIVKIADFFVSPKQDVEKENVLLSGEIVTHIHIPPVGGSVKSCYRKVMARGSWDFALASAATVLHFENGKIHKARIVLGGVGPYPWTASAAEKALAGSKMDDGVAAAAAEAAVSGAAPLRDNAYKLEIVKGAVKESLAGFI
jgi:xanthine dehydrogenase YagS FAD-binding subunit